MRRGVDAVVLCEDLLHACAIRYVLRALGFHPRRIRERVAPSGRGSAEQWVREQFPEQLAAQRARGGEKIVLIVVIDADNRSTAERRETVLKHLEAVAGARPTPEEPVFWAIPKWEMETWMEYLREGTFDEERKDNPKVYSGRESECRPEVEKLIRMCREKNLVPPPPASLLDACVEYERLMEYLG